MTHLDTVSAILTALGPTATAVLGYFMKRSDARKLRKIEEITHEVKPNSGVSLRDAVDRIEKTLGTLIEAVESNTSRIEHLELRARAARRPWSRRLI